MKLAFSTLGCPDWSLEQIAENAAAYGFQGVELRIGGKRHVDPSMTQHERAAVKQMFKEKNIEICSLAGYSAFCSDKEEDLMRNRELLIEGIYLARDLGAPYVRTFIGDYPAELTEDKVAAIAAENLNICSETAEKNGVTIIIETHDSFSTGAEVNKILSQIRNEAVAVLWDIHHPLSKGESLEQTYALLGKYIKHVHLKDAIGEDVYLMGKGNLPVKQAVEILRSNGYRGYLSLEWEKMWIKELEEPEIAFPQYIEYMKDK